MVDELPEASDGHGGGGGEGGRPAGLGCTAGSAAAHPALHPALLLLLVKGVATWVAATIFEKKNIIVLENDGDKIWFVGWCFIFHFCQAPSCQSI